MTDIGYALARAELIRTLTAYSGITTSDGAADGTTLIDSNLIDSPVISENAIPEKTILIMSGDAIQQDKGASLFSNVTGTITLQGTGFGDQILAGTIYKILNISSIEIDVATIDTKIGTNADAIGTTTLFAWLAKIFASGVAIAGTVDDVAPAAADFDTDLTEATNEHYRGMFLMFLDGDCIGQGHTIDSYTGATKNMSFAAGDVFTDAPADGDSFVILPAEGRLLQLALAALVGATGQFNEQADVPITINAINASETDVFDLNAATTRYIVRSLRLKAVDPGANTITVRLRELINDVSTVVDTFDITTANFGTHHSLMDMFGVPYLTGDDLQVTVRCDAGGPYAVTGEYSHGKTNV